MRNQEQWPDRTLEESRRRSERLKDLDRYLRGDIRQPGEDERFPRNRDDRNSEPLGGGDRGSTRHSGEQDFGANRSQIGRGGGYGGDDRRGSSRDVGRTMREAHGGFGGEGGWGSEGGTHHGEQQAYGGFGHNPSQSAQDARMNRRNTHGSQDQHQGHHHHDDDYMLWRNEQIGKLDEDYKTWQGERREKFADEFDQWRTERSTVAGRQTGSDSASTKK